MFPSVKTYELPEAGRPGGREAPFMCWGLWGRGWCGCHVRWPTEASSALCALMPSCPSPWHLASRLSPATGRQWIVLFWALTPLAPATELRVFAASKSEHGERLLSRLPLPWPVGGLEITSEDGRHSLLPSLSALIKQKGEWTGTMCYFRPDHQPEARHSPEAHKCCPVSPSFLLCKRNTLQSLWWYILSVSVTGPSIN